MPRRHIHPTSTAPAAAVATSARPTAFEGCHRVSARNAAAQQHRARPRHLRAQPAHLLEPERRPGRRHQQPAATPAPCAGRETSSSPASGPNTKTGGARSRYPASARIGPQPAGTGRASADEALDVRQEGQLARPLDGGAELALVPGAGARQPARQDLAALGQEPGQRPLILVSPRPARRSRRWRRSSGAASFVVLLVSSCRR